MRREDRRLIVQAIGTRPRRVPHPTKPALCQVAAELTRHDISIPRQSGAWSATLVARVLERTGAEMTARSTHRLAALAHAGDRLAQGIRPDRAGDHGVTHHEGRRARKAELVAQANILLQDRAHLWALHVLFDPVD